MSGLMGDLRGTLAMFAIRDKIRKKLAYQASRAEGMADEEALTQLLRPAKDLFGDQAIP